MVKKEGVGVKKDNTRTRKSSSRKHDRTQLFLKRLIWLLILVIVVAAPVTYLGVHIDNPILIWLPMLMFFSALLFFLFDIHAKDLKKLRKNGLRFFPRAALTIDFWAPLDPRFEKRDWRAIYKGISIICILYLIVANPGDPREFDYALTIYFTLFYFIGFYPIALVEFYGPLEDYKEEEEENREPWKKEEENEEPKPTVVVMGK